MKLRPFTIFNVVNASDDSLNSETKLGSQIFQWFAKAVLCDNVDFVTHSELVSIESAAIEKSTEVYRIHLEILNTDKHKIKFTDKLLEYLLTTFAQLVTSKLKSYNEQAISLIVTKMDT